MNSRTPASSNPEEPIRLLAVDIDDTLVNEDLSISPANRAALLAAEDGGVTVLLASGRVPEAMQSFAEELGMHEREGYMISGNGTLLLRSDTDEVLVRHTIPIDEAIAAFREVDALGIPVTAYYGNMIHASRTNRWVEEDCRLSGFGKIVEDDFAGFIRKTRPLKLLVQADPEQVIQLERELKFRHGAHFNIITSKPFFLELLPKQADKGTALQFLAEHLGIPRSQVMAIGDSINDLGMIRYAGYGVAVGNALAEVKAAARFVLTRHHGEDAVAEAVEQFILGPRKDAVTHRTGFPAPAQAVSQFR